MTKIVVTNNQDFSKEQKQKLESLGDVTYYDDAPNGASEYLKRVRGFDVICSGTAGLKDAYPQLNNVYVTVPFVSVAFLDPDVLKKNKVTISNAPGANKYAVSEWIIGMMIMLARKLDVFVNTKETFRKNGKLPPLTKGLAEQNITILGKGNIGSRVGEVATALGMNVRFFKRGEDLHKAVEDADFVVDTLSSNPSTHGLLGKDFFAALKQGSYFVTVTGPKIIDEDAMLEALDNDHLAGVATDCGKILVGDTEDIYYQRFLNHPKVLVTPHVSYNTSLSMKTGCDIMINNVEAWLAGKPQNIVVK